MNPDKQQEGTLCSAIVIGNGACTSLCDLAAHNGSSFSEPGCFALTTVSSSFYSVSSIFLFFAVLCARNSIKGQEGTVCWLISLQRCESLPLSRLNPPMITFPVGLFRHPDTRGLPGSSCLNEEPQAQWTESLFHNQLTTIPHVWCQWTALSILGSWLRNCKQQSFHEQCFPAEAPEKTKVRWCERAPPLPVPRTTLQIHDSSCLSWNYQSAWKMLLWKSTVTKDLIPKATKVLPNNKTDHSSVREQLSSLYSRGRSTNDPAYHWKKGVHSMSDSFRHGQC